MGGMNSALWGVDMSRDLLAPSPVTLCALPRPHIVPGVQCSSMTCSGGHLGFRCGQVPSLATPDSDQQRGPPRPPADVLPPALATRANTPPVPWSCPARHAAWAVEKAEGGLGWSSLSGRPHCLPVCASTRPATPPHLDTMAAGAGETCTFVVVSDTHNQHRGIGVLPFGDVLLHCGDLTKGGSLGELADFAAWWHAQPHKEKVVIAGASAVC